MHQQPTTIARRRGNLATIWLAATLGTKAAFRRISKKEITEVNIRISCDYVRQPPEPLAFRYSSSLLVGITRIYHHQCVIHYNNVQVIMLQIKKAFGEFKAKEMTLIDIEVPKGGKELFTLEEQPEVILNELPPESLRVGLPTIPLPLPRTQLPTPEKPKYPISVPLSEITLSPPESFLGEPYEPLTGYPSSLLGTPLGLGGMELEEGMEPWAPGIAALSPPSPLLFDLGLEPTVAPLERAAERVEAEKRKERREEEEARQQRALVPAKRKKKLDLMTELSLREFDTLLAMTMEKKRAHLEAQQYHQRFRQTFQSPYLLDLTPELANLCIPHVAMEGLRAAAHAKEEEEEEEIERAREAAIERAYLEGRVTPPLAPLTTMPWTMMPESPEEPSFAWSPMVTTSTLPSISPSPTLREYPSPLASSIESPLFFAEEPPPFAIEPTVLPDRESDAFRSYAKSIMDAAHTDQLYLSDLIEAAGSKKSAAAQALYHVLVLVTRHQATAFQDIPYGPITLSIF